jgi:3-oxoacyl-[acyl-carrier protein] reductase
VSAPDARSAEARAAPLEGRRALVTGSSSGIGAAVARELAAQGATVAVHARTEARARETADQIRDHGGHAVVLTADLTDESAAGGLVDRAAQALGGLDILVNNAGASLIGPSLETTVEDWRRIMALNLTSPFLCAQAAGRHMGEAGGGVIINIGSAFGHVGVPERAAYCSAKHGMVGLTKVLATEWASLGIRVLSVDPGVVMTELVSRNADAGRVDLDGLERRTPLGRLADPAELARVVAFMASPSASFVTGAAVLVDGGWSAFGAWWSASGMNGDTPPEP